MSDYVKITDFAIKDSYPSGNPAKVVKGTEHDNEYNAIAVASATKADKADPTFTGTVTADNITFTGTMTGTIDGGTY